jgi:hypothetical protein
MRSLHLAVATAKERLQGPLLFHVAMGHGRSYGIEAGYLGKIFLGIFQCGLWEELQRDGALSTVACVTDIGNDLAYEIPVEEVLDWVTRCLDRLQECEARVVVTALPMVALMGVGKVRFSVLRAVLFPRCRLAQGELLERAKRLDAGLRELAEVRKIPIFSAPNAWYGLDPIHPRRSQMKAWWNSQFDLVGAKEVSSVRVADSWLMRTYLRCLKPPAISSAHSDQASLVRRVALHNETTIALYA